MLHEQTSAGGQMLTPMLLCHVEQDENLMAYYCVYDTCHIAKNQWGTLISSENALWPDLEFINTVAYLVNQYSPHGQHTLNIISQGTMQTLCV